MRELRHDFRAFYGCRYDDCDPAEAIDLIATLPNGSLFLAALNPRQAWSDELNAMYDLFDSLWKFIWMKSEKGTTEGAPQAERPWYAAERSKRRARAHGVRERLENTRWEDVDHG